MWNTRTFCARASFAIVVTLGCATGRQQARPDAADTASGRPLPQTGAVTSLQPATGAAESLTIEQYLLGKVPGLQVVAGPNGSFTLRLRGSNFRLAGGGEVQPLVVIDGMPIAAELMNRVLSTLRPSDIVRVDVLRDVASTSVYGMRGASGVILIRTNGG